MRAVKGRVAFVCGVALTIAAASNGCSGSLTGNPGTAGTGGAASDSGRAGTSGTAGTSGMGGGPDCPSTVTKGAVCTPTDAQLCYKPCGPEKVGAKSETCSTGGVYVEMSGCSFDPSRDYSCYNIPGFANPICPAGVPQAATACDVPRCSLCNSNQGVAGGQYVDVSGAPKIGYCVCQAPNSAGVRTWSCASDTQWPCPASHGCTGIGIGGRSGGGSAGSGGGSAGSGTGGAAGTSGGGFGQPACPSTVAKGAACAATDVPFCYKTCGPEKTGVKSETCAGGVYAEMSGCSFDPGRDYSCYAIPGAVPNLACPVAVPQASARCDVPACTACNSNQGLPGGQYTDASGAVKIGFCVCQAPNASGLRVWSCASDTQWPCPAGVGCSGPGIGGSGGTVGTGGSSGAGGAAGAGGASFGAPACPATVTKGGACATTDVQLCYKTCGPERTGVKADTCTGGVYAEMSGCTFDPTRDYSCYKIPSTSIAACGTDTPIAGTSCDVAPCQLCNSTEGLPGGTYFDSAGVPKLGYCVCQAPNSAGTRSWSCASDTAWPCPGAAGC
jgi:hypothetical protein